MNSPSRAIFDDPEAWHRAVPAEFATWPAFDFVDLTGDLPRVLLIGDSISIGYTIPVRTRLSDVASVARIPANGSSTIATLRSLPAWLGGRDWDVIHANWGLHDVALLATLGRGRTGHAVVRDAYQENLEQLVLQLRRRCSALILGTTTPVPEGAKLRRAGDEIAYNAVLAAVADAHGLPTNDLWRAAADDPELQLPANVHFTDRGYERLGDVVAQAIRGHLATLEEAR
jgi:acyl-CoA thioesterase-1